MVVNWSAVFAGDTERREHPGENKRRIERTRRITPEVFILPIIF
jgi:hypothetical protein